MGGTIDARTADALLPFFETSSIGMVACALDGVILRANNAAAELLGLPLDEIIGHTGLDRLEPRERAMAERQLADARANRFESTRNLYRYIDPAERERWFDVETTLLHAVDGSPSHVISVLRDVTHQHRVEDALENSSTSLAHLVEHAPVAIVSVTVEGVVLTWNPAATAMFGWDAAEAIGKPLPVLPEEMDNQLRLALRRLSRGEEMTSQPMAARHRDGQIVHIVTSASARRDSSGEVDAIVAYAIDVSDRVAAEKELLTKDRRFRRMVDNLSEVVAIIDPSGKVLASTVFAGSDSSSSGGEATTRVGLEEILPLLHSDDHEAAFEFLQDLAQSPGVEQRRLFRILDPRRGWAWIETTAVNHTNDPDIGGIVLTAHDVSGHKRNEALLADQASVLELIARGAPLGDVLDAIVAMVSEHSTRSTTGIVLLEDDRIHLAAGDLPDALADALGSSDAQQRCGMLRAALERREAVVVADAATDLLTVDTRDLLADVGLHAGWATPILRSDDGEALGLLGTWFEDTRGPSSHERNVANAAARLADIAIERARVADDLDRAARFDQLTGLPNRTQLLDHMSSALERAAAHHTNVAVMFLDLDRFKLVNDSLGHTVGDKLMRAFGARLQEIVRPGDIVGRFEGDEFVVVLENVLDELEVRSITNRLELALSEPFPVASGEVVLTASVGVALSTGEEPAHALLQNADVALVLAKEGGRNRIEMFNDELRTRARNRLDLERDLRVAIKSGELAVFFQPKIDLRTGKMLGAEALLRWFHPTRGMVGPVEFIPVAEETGLITRIGRWVIDESLHQGRTWLDRGKGEGPLTLSVNLSARQLRAPDLVSDVERALLRHDWSPDHLILELTESILIDDTDGVIRRLDEIKSLGVRLAVDDFGTGYSSLSYLDQLPVDVVKIDRAFVSRVQADGQGSAIVSAVLHLAEELDLIVLAEGVEEAHQLAGLRHLDCHWAQGYYFAKPMPAEEMTALLDTNPVW